MSSRSYIPAQMDLGQIRSAMARLESDRQRGIIDDQTYYDIRMQLETMMAVLEGSEINNEDLPR